MPAERLSMRKVREVLRLKYACGVSARVISRSLGIGRTVVVIGYQAERVRAAFPEAEVEWGYVPMSEWVDELDSSR